MVPWGLVTVLGSLWLTATATPVPAGGLARRIVGGTPVAALSEFPSIVSLQDPLAGFTGCAGTILSPTVVVTAAHCSKRKPGEPLNLQVRVGSLKHGSGGEVVDVKYRLLPDRWDPDTVHYDVALLVLERPLDLSARSPLRAARLVPAIGQIKKGQDMKVAGWGLTRSPQGDYTLADASPVLQQVTLRTIDTATCNRRHNGEITPQMFCTDARAKDTCWGDSGGPLFDTRTGCLVGIVSWANGGCANPKGAGVNTNLADREINSWIRRNENKT